MLELLIILFVCLSRPALGGSTIKVSHSNLSSITFDTSLHIKVALSILFSSLL